MTEHEFSDADDRPVPLDEPSNPEPPVADDDEPVPSGEEPAELETDDTE